MIEAEHVPVDQTQPEFHLVPQAVVQEDRVDKDEDPDSAGQRDEDVGHVLGKIGLDQESKGPSQPCGVQE